MSRPAVVFGDVHGDAFALRVLIRKIREQFGYEVDIFSLGDLIDRGPDSKDVIQTCVDEGIHGILGNHEIWFHQYLATGQFDNMALHPAMKGGATLRSYGVHSISPGTIERELKSRVPESHKRFILGLPTYRKIVVDGVDYWLIHSGLKKTDGLAFNMEQARENYGQPPGEDEVLMMDAITAMNPGVLMWTSPNPYQSNLHKFNNGGVQIFGHRPVKLPIIRKTYIAMDTGCGTCPPYRLSAICLPDRTIISSGKPDPLEDSDGFVDL